MVYSSPILQFRYDFGIEVMDMWRPVNRGWLAMCGMGGSYPPMRGFSRA